MGGGDGDESLTGERHDCEDDGSGRVKESDNTQEWQCGTSFIRGATCIFEESGALHCDRE
jgi:hypothetical protein